MSYIVRHLQNDTYQVIELQESDEENIDENLAYQGSLSDCEAYIRLHEGGYI